MDWGGDSPEVQALSIPSLSFPLPQVSLHSDAVSPAGEMGRCPEGLGSRESQASGSPECGRERPGRHVPVDSSPCVFGWGRGVAGAGLELKPHTLCPVGQAGLGLSASHIEESSGPLDL